MPAFNDGGGHDWVIRFDGITLGELKEAHGINLADITGESYVTLETDQTALTKAVCFLCRDQLEKNGVTAPQLANLLCGEVAEAAMAAIWGAAKSFFRPKLWSGLQSAYAQRQAAMKQWAEIAPVMALLNQPEMPAAMREVVMGQLASMMDEMSSGSQRLTDMPSATGPVAVPSKPATDSPEPVESARAA